MEWLNFYRLHQNTIPRPPHRHNSENRAIERNQRQETLNRIVIDRMPQPTTEFYQSRRRVHVEAMTHDEINSLIQGLPSNHVR